MTDLAHVSHDDLLAEVSKRLGEGRFGFHGLMAPHQQDYHHMWSQGLDAVRHEGHDPWAPSAVFRLLNRFREIADSQPQRVVVYALNTTFLGAEDRVETMGRAA